MVFTTIITITTNKNIHIIYILYNLRTSLPLYFMGGNRYADNGRNQQIVPLEGS